MNNLLIFSIKRLLSMIVVVWIIATIVFFLAHLTPNDPVVEYLGIKATPHNVAATRHALGIDGPLWQQYVNFIKGAAHGDFGRAEERGYWGQPVWSIIKNGLPVSLKIGGLALFFALLISLPVGLISALKQNTWIDHVIQFMVMAMYALPAFVVAPFAQVIFGVDLGWFPVAGWGDPGTLGFKEMVLPIAVFSTQIAGYYAKSFRSFMLEVLNQDYIRTAHAKGLKERLVIFRHAVKNTLLPLASIVGPSIAFLVAGAFIIEIYFAIPGIGAVTVNSVIAGDYPVIQTTTILIASAVVFVNALTDIFYAMVDPRVRL